MSESPIRQLAAEHEHVRLVVGAMDDEVAYIERTGNVHTARLTQMVDFTRNFTDGDHHAKEEDILFPLTEELLSVQEQEILAEGFGRLADAEGAAEAAERYHRLAHDLSTPSAD
jgi:hemerythrin-like domain-containing protein